MFPDIKSRVKKAGQPPGTMVFTGVKKVSESSMTVVTFSPHDFHETSGTDIKECLPRKMEKGVMWVHVEGLQNVELIKAIAEHFNLHPLTIEDILNVNQRAKVEEFDGYIFITIKVLSELTKQGTLPVEQFSIVMGENFVLSFAESHLTLFNNIRERLRSGAQQRLRQQGADYLTYRLLDTIIDQYFVVLEGVGDLIEETEERIISDPKPQTARNLYRLKRQMMGLRKAIWPAREVMSHLLQIDGKMISSFAHIYFRDVYDHVAQAIDTIETFRDMLSGLLDVYLSTLSNRMNEIMKVLTIIATIFIPITFIASIYGMNFKYMPELNWRWGYPIVLIIMAVVALIMLVYFRRKKWI